MSHCTSLVGSQMLSFGSKAKKAAILSKRETAAGVLAEKQRIRAEKAYAKDAAKVGQKQNIFKASGVARKADCI